MAQIKKYKEGDKVSKLGKLVWNGEELSSDQFIAFKNWAAKNSSTVGNVASEMIKAVESGKTISYDPVKRTVTGLPDVNAYSERANKRIHKNRISGIGDAWDHLTNSDRKQFANQIWAIGDWTPAANVAPTAESAKEKEKEKRSIAFTNRTVDYNPTETERYMQTSNNAAILSLIDTYTEYLNDADRANNWTITGNDARRKEIDTFYLANPERLAAYKAAIQAGVLDDETIQNLKNDLLITANNYTKSQEDIEKDEKAKAEEKTQIGQLLNPDDWQNYGITWGLNKDGNIMASGYVPDMMYHLNSFSPVDPQSEYFNGFMLNGQLYTEQEFRNNPDLINRWKAAAELIKNQDWDRLRLNNTVQYLWGKDPYEKYNAETEYANIGVNLPNGASYWNMYNHWDIPEGQHALAWIDPNAPADPLTGIQPAQYAIYDPLTGETIQSDFATNPIQRRLNPWQEGQSGFQYAPVTGYIEHNGHKYAKVRDYYQNTTDESPLYSFYRNATDGNIYMEQDGEFFLVNPKYYNQIRQPNYVFQDVDFENMIEGKYKMLPNGKLKKTQVGTAYGLGPQYSWLGNQIFRYTDPYEGKIKGSEQGGKLYKDGGVLKLSNGGHTGESTKTGHTAKTVNKSVKDYRLEDANPFDKNTMTDADWLELGAIAGDVAGTIMSLIPGANVAGAVTGMGATGAQFVSDVKRDGLDGSDILYGLNSLGLDALTLIPFVGSGAKAIKVARTIQKGAKAIGTAFAFHGLHEGADGLKNIVNGNWNISDLRKVALGLQSVVGTGKAVSSRVGKAKFAADVAKNASTPLPKKLKGSIKVGDKDLSFELTAKEIADAKISSGYNKNNDANIKNLLETKIKAAAQNAGVQLPDDFNSKILNEVRIDGNPLDVKSRFKFFGDESYVLNEPEIETTGSLSKNWAKNLVKRLDPIFGKSQFDNYGNLRGVKPTSTSAKKAQQEMMVWNPERFWKSWEESNVVPTSRYIYGPLSSRKRNWPDALPYIQQMQNRTINTIIDSKKIDPIRMPFEKQVSIKFPEIWNGQNLRGLNAIPNPNTLDSPDLKLPTFQSLLKQPFNLPNEQMKGLVYSPGQYLPAIKGNTDLFAHSTMPATRNLPSPYVWHFAHQPKPKIIPTKIIIVDAIDPNAPKQTAQSILGLPYTQQLMLPEQGTINVTGFKKGGKLVQKAKDGLPSLGGINTLDNILYPTLTKPKSLYSSNVSQYTGDPNVDGIDMNDGKMLDEVVVTASKKRPNMSIDDSQTVAAANTWIDNFAKSLGVGKAPTVKETETTLKDAFGITPRSEITSALLPDLSKKYGHLQLSAVDAIKQYKGNSTKATDDTDVGQEPKSNKFPLELALRAGKLITTIGNNNKAHDQLKDSLRASANAALQQGPTEIYDNFKMSPLLHAYKNAADNQRGMQFVGNDWTAVAAMQQQANQQANMFDVEFAKELTGALDKHNASNLDARRNYAKGRADIANTNRGILSNLYGKLGEAEFSKDRNNATSIQNAFNEGLGMIQQEKQNQFEKNNMLFSQEVNEATRKARQEYLTGSGLQAQYDALDENERSSYGNILNWMEAKRKGQFQEYLGIKGSVTKNAVNDLYKPKETLLSRFLKLV